MTVIILETSGKHERVDFARVHLFRKIEDARLYVEGVSTGPGKHWRHAEIVEEDTDVSLVPPAVQ